MEAEEEAKKSLTAPSLACSNHCCIWKIADCFVTQAPWNEREMCLLCVLVKQFSSYPVTAHLHQLNSHDIRSGPNSIFFNPRQSQLALL